MSRMFKLILVTTLFSFISASNVEIKEDRVSYSEGVEQCSTDGSRIANISDINVAAQDEKPCQTENWINAKYWIENDKKLSNIISVEGCFTNPVLENMVPKQEILPLSLRDCYRRCTDILKDPTIFAYKNNTGETNCICNLTTTDVNKPLKVRNSSECISLNKTSWWKYKVHKDIFSVGINGTCKTISCSRRDLTDPFLKDILCGSHIGQAMDDDLRYVCTNSTNDKMSKRTFLPGIFSFMLNTSTTGNSQQHESLFNKCRAVACLDDSIYETIVTDCTSNISGVVCLNRNSSLFSTKRTPSSTSLSSMNISIHRSQQPELRTSHISTSKMQSESNSKGSNTVASLRPTQPTDATIQDSFTFLLQNTSTYKPTPAQSYITLSQTFMSTVTTSQIKDPSKRAIFSSTSTYMSDPSVQKAPAAGLLVGLLATAVVIVIAVVVLLGICRFKRKGPFRNKRFGDESQIAEFHGQNDHNTDIASKKEPHIVNNSTYEMQAATANVNELSLLEQDSNNIPNSEYAVVIKKSKMIDNVNNQQQSHDEENLDVIENEYDGLNHNRPDNFTNRNNTTNIYDTALGVRDTSDSTYVTANHVHVVDKDENCVYDHM